jgi:hypothetical protein
LCRALTAEDSLSCYLYSAQTASPALTRFTEEFRCRFFQKMEPARTSALIAQSLCFITADTALFRTGNLIGNTSIGLFAQTDSARYCTESKTSRGISWAGKPSDMPVDAVIQAVLAATGKAVHA